MSTQVIQGVQDTYGKVAREGLDRDYAERVAKSFGYSAAELQSIPDEANMGLSCGNPTAMAHIQPGEHVVDLGSGGGLDVFLAASQVGKTGQVVGLDANTDMIALARRNARKSGLAPPHVAFHQASMGSTALPVTSGSVDCILSNCVLNLVETEHKAYVISELYRMLRPGGRLAIHDILAKHELDEPLKANIFLYVGCISGAIPVDAFEAMLRDAGFQDIVMVDQKSDLNIYFQDGGVGCCGALNAPAATSTTASSCKPTSASSSCCGPSKAAPTPAPAIDFSTFDANEHASSYSIYAIKPGTKPAQSLPDILAEWPDA